MQQLNRWFKETTSTTDRMVSEGALAMGITRAFKLPFKCSAGSVSTLPFHARSHSGDYVVVLILEVGSTLKWTHM